MECAYVQLILQITHTYMHRKIHIFGADYLTWFSEFRPMSPHNLVLEAAMHCLPDVLVTSIRILSVHEAALLISIFIC